MLRLDVTKRELSWDGVSVGLSNLGCRMMETLILADGALVPIAVLSAAMWGSAPPADVWANLKVHKCLTLRRMRMIGAQADIEMVRHVGYRLRCDGAVSIFADCMGSPAC